MIRAPSSTPVLLRRRPRPRSPDRRRRRLPLLALAGVLAVVAGAPPLNAQTPLTCMPDWCGGGADDWRGGVGAQGLVFAANVAVGGLTAGIRQRHRGGGFRDGFLRGAAGGAGTWVGKRVAMSEASYAGAAGRAIAAVGSSVIRNASFGESSFQRLTVPLGPVRLHWNRDVGGVSPALDVFAVAAIVGAYASGMGASLDVRRTLSSGTPVFLARSWEDGWGWDGRQLAGSILLRGDWVGSAHVEAFRTRVLAHERAHVLQYDQVHILWGEEVDDRLMRRLGLASSLREALDVSLLGAAVAGASAVAPVLAEPWEWEADILARTYPRHHPPLLGWPRP